MTLKPFWCYYGGKWRSAPRYPSPRYRRIIEPFAGAAGYSTRYHDRDIVLAEKDPIIAGLWRWLIKSRPADILALPLAIPEGGVDALEVEPEARSLIGFWLNKGASRPMKTPSAWMRGGTHASSFWGEVVRDRIAAQVEAIKHWTVIEGGYEYLIQDEATYFVDPPYQRAGKHYRCSEIDYTRLGTWCRALPGQAIVCEEVGADWLPFEPFITAKANESRHGGKKCREAIWLSERSTASHSFGGDQASTSAGGPSTSAM